MKRILASFLIALFYSCSLPDGDQTYEKFDNRLLGTWEANPDELDSIPRIKIEPNYITIMGKIAHFGSLRRDTKFEGYSDTSFIYIKARNEIFSFAYLFWESPENKMITLKNGALEDIDFKKLEDSALQTTLYQP